MSEDLQRAHDILGVLFMGLPPALFVLVSVALLGLALQAAWHAWRHHRIAHALATAPLVNLRSNAAGLVKLRGTVQPPPTQPGKAPTAIVWYSRTRRSGSDSSTLTTTDNFLLHDEHGVCAVDARKTTILPSSSEAKEGFLDKSRSSVEGALYRGDSVFALGQLRRGLPPLAGVAQAPCQLARCGGVLLVSGGTESEARLHSRMWFWVQAPLALLWLFLLGFGAWAHVVSYPEGDAGPVATFVDALWSTPFKSGAGLDHPLWIQGQAEPTKVPPRADPQ